MKKMRKALISVLLGGLMSVCLGVGVSNIEKNAQSVAAESVVTATETTSVTNMHVRDNFLLFFTSANDYANAGSNTSVGATGMTDYNTLDKVQIYTTSGEVLPLWKVVSGTDCYKRYGENNSVAYQLNGTCNGTTIAGVYIPEGTEFPSYEYTNNGGTAKAYVTDKAYTLMSNDTSNATFVTSWTVSSRGEVAEEETSVTKVHLRATNRLLLFLSASDYAETGATTEITGKTALTNYNTLDKILVYTANGEYTFRETVSSATYYNVWGETGSIAYDFKSGFDNTNVTKIVIPAGTEFPAFNYTNKGGEQKAYVTTQNVIYTNNGVGADSTNWSAKVFGAAKEDAPVEIPAIAYDTTASGLKYQNNRLGFYISENDYANAENNSFTLVETDFAKWNTLTNIQVNGKTLADMWNGDVAFMNMWTETALWIPMAAPVDGDVVSIPAGTQFPSYSAVSGDIANTYVTTNDINYVYVKGVWAEKIDFTQTMAAASIHRIGDARLMISVSESDYATATANTPFSKDKLAQLNTLENITLNGVAFSELNISECFVNLYASGAIAFGKINVQNGDVITIKAGTQFPTAAFVTDNTATCYVTEKEISFKYQQVSADGSQPADWTEVLVFDKVATQIARVDFNDTGSDNILHVYLTENDYGTKDGSVDFKAVISNLNTYDFIEINGVKLSNMNLGSQLINFWTRWGAFGLQLNDYSATNAPSYIYVKAGCELPSLAYVKGEALTAYVVEEDTWIAYNEYNGVWEITAKKPENLVNAGETLPVYASVGTRIFIGWEIGGALYKGGAVAPVTGLAQAIWVDYALEKGASIRMADTAEESGIRFTATLQESSFNTYADYINSIGVLVLPMELMGEESFTVEHSAEPVNFYALKEKGYTFADGVMLTRGTIYAVRATNFNRDYAARAYVCVNYADGTTDYAYGEFQEENHVRNIYEVATAAYKTGDGTDVQRTVLVAYASRIVDVTFDGTTVTATAGVIGSAITEIQTQSVAGNVVTISVVTASEQEPLLIVNGMPIRGAQIVSKEYANNVFVISFVYATDAE